MLLLLLMWAWRWVRPLPIMQWVHQSRNGTRVASCYALFCPLSPASLAGPTLLQSTTSPSSSDSLSSLSSALFHQLLPTLCFLIVHLYRILPALQACRNWFDHSPSLPSENWTCFIEANPHVHCAHSAVHVQLDHRSISNISNMRIVFTNTTISSSDDFLD